MRRGRRIAWALLALLGVVLLGLVAALVAVNQGWQRERLRVEVEAQLTRALGEPVAVGRIAGPLLPRLDVRDLRVGPADDPTLVVDRLVVGLGWRRSLASRDVVLRRIAVEGAQLTVTRDSSGTWQIPQWLAGEGDDEGDAGDPPVAIRVGRTVLEDVAVRVHFLEQGEPAALEVAVDARLGPWSVPTRPDETLQGSVRASARGEGAAARWLEQAQLEATLDGSRLALEALSIDGGDVPTLQLVEPATVAWRDDRLVVSGLALESEAQRVRIDGALTREGFDGLRVDLLDLDVTLAGRLLGGTVEPGGRVSGDARLDGPFARPEGHVALVWSDPSLGTGADRWSADRVTLQASGDGREIRVETLSVEGMPGGPLRLAAPARLRIGDGGVTLSGVELRSAEQALVANGAITGDAFRDLALELRALDVALLGRVLGLPGAPGGTLSGDAVLDGPFERPRGEVSLRWLDPRFADWRGESIALRASVDREAARLDVTLRQAPGETLALDASLPASALATALEPGSALRERGALPQGLRAHVASEGVSLAALHPLLPAAQRLEGTLAGDVEVRGGAQPIAEGLLTLTDATLTLPERAPIEGLRAELSLEPLRGRLAIERFQLDAPGLEVSASGVITRQGGLAPLEVHVAAPDLAALAAAWNLEAPLEGALTADATLEGSWPRPAIRGAVRWTHAAPDAVVPHRAELTVASDDRGLEGELAVHQAQRVAAEGQVRMPYPDAGLLALPEAVDDARLTLEAEDFDLATVSPLLPRLVRDLRGRVDARVVIRPGEAGDSEPSIAGTLHLRDASVRVPALRQTFAPIEGSIALRNEALEIDTLQIGEAGAGATLSGEVRLDDLSPAAFDLTLALAEFPVARSRPLTTDVTGTLELNGPPDALHLGGEIALSDARIRLVDPGDPVLREIQVVRSDAERRGLREMQEQPQPPDAFEQATVDVELTVPRNTWVRGRGAELDLAGTLRVEKTPGDALRVSGRVATLRGTYRFQGKRFDLRRGAVIFAGTTEIDPTLDIQAVHRVRDVTIVIELTGTASEPVVTLTSEPSLPEDDVLSYLFFGRPTEELGSRQPTGDLDRAATAFAAGVALRQASRLVEETLPIDTIDVRLEDDGATGGVGVGKYVTEDLFVRYERGFGEDADDGVRLELRLNDHWSIETDVSTDESAGADLVWSLDF